MRPDCYVFDDSWYQPRTRGYSPGNVRSLSPPPLKTAKWLNTLDSVATTCSFTEQRPSEGQPALETRYSTLQLSKEWSRFRSERFKRNVERKEEREREADYRGEMDRETDVTCKSIALFERRLRAMADPGRGRKKPVDSDSDSEEEVEEEEKEEEEGEEER
jgi:hypothetical protein